MEAGPAPAAHGQENSRAKPPAGQRACAAATPVPAAARSMDDLNDWLDHEAGLAALQGACGAVSALLALRKLDAIIWSRPAPGRPAQRPRMFRSVGCALDCFLAAPAGAQVSDVVLQPASLLKVFRRTSDQFCEACRVFQCCTRDHSSSRAASALVASVPAAVRGRQGGYSSAWWSGDSALCVRPLSWWGRTAAQRCFYGLRNHCCAFH